ncbi:hypothetical protein P152DRAFT_331165 [Eremomyces bilateralis CBS 781.70]|uniref:Uncharacterized protein n=1 Tax=Eremomyces bilateralis CBS 781.70 TaxID=1392243 RepID=A0A6G1G4V1_9PEZI|nr:uncharacterized protein P152DRAFT_331165 [Eremomyces bilateralis CBS 781.70]KAF1812940.1 hypothetical protein P152DRAFT_331165 [Eremomyces bilateralis CBS 781.70]
MMPSITRQEIQIVKETHYGCDGMEPGGTPWSGSRPLTKLALVTCCLLAAIGVLVLNIPYGTPHSA